MGKNRKAVAWLCAALLLIVLTGCGNQIAPAVSTNPVQEKAQVEASKEESPAADTQQEESVQSLETEERSDMPEVASIPQAEDFAGEYTCTTISFGDDVLPLQEEPYMLTIDGDEAVVVGINELGTDPLKLQFEDGELYWVPPEEDTRVFTLRLLEDGVVTLSFDTIPEAPVFRFDPVKSK